MTEPSTCNYKADRITEHISSIQNNISGSPVAQHHNPDFSNDWNYPL